MEAWEDCCLERTGQPLQGRGAPQALPLHQDGDRQPLPHPTNQGK